MTCVWVIGGNGLLGTALTDVMVSSGVKLFRPAEKILWDSESKLKAQLKLMVAEFSIFIKTESDWQIYWAAGVGFMGSDKSELQTETLALTILLSLIELQHPLISANGCFAFASSAGAIYAGTTDYIVNEDTSISPTTAYAEEKIKQEELISIFAKKNSNVSVLLARISTLYGTVSRSSKRKGLLTEMARRIVRNQPIQIYVPFDTIRDYITADDAAKIMVSAANAVLQQLGIFVKIIASSQPVTIAEIISVFKQVSHRPPKIVTSASKLSNAYKHQIQFSSIVMPSINCHCQTSILVGIFRVMAAERLSFSRYG